MGGGSSWPSPGVRHRAVGEELRVAARTPVLETFPALRAWQRKAMVEYLRRRSDDFIAVATPGAGKTTFALRIAAELLGRRHGRGGHRGRPDRAPQDPVGRRRGPGRHPARRRVPQRRPALRGRLPRRGGHLRAGGHGPAGAPAAHHDPTHAGHPRRDPPRRRLPVLGRRGEGRLRARRTPADAHRHAVPLRRQPDPVRHATSAAATGCCAPASDSVYGYADALRDGVVRPVHLPGVLRRDPLAHQRRRRAGRPARRADDPGPGRAGVAYRAGPDRRLDAAGAAGRRRPAARAAQRRACPTPAVWSSPPTSRPPARTPS